MTKRTGFFLFLIVLVAYALGLSIDIMQIDAAQYALIAMEMLQSESFLVVKHYGGDYLDKPPLLFWLSAFSFELFGFSNAAYKLPSVLGLLLAVFSVYGFAKLHYGKNAALISAIVLASSQAFFTIANDCKTDNLLIGSVSLAIWQWSAYLNSKKLSSLLLGFLGIGLGMLAKGPIGVIVPLFAIGSELLLKKKWAMLFNWQWILGLPVLALLLLPMCMGLYEQFGKEGLRFFFWTQSFGRITGESKWDNDATAMFFVHTFAWSFLPWTLLFCAALFDRIKKKFNVSNPLVEYASLGGFVLTFAALSLSRFKLPHYIFVTYPMAAVMVGSYLAGLIDKEKTLRAFHWVQGVLSLLVLMAALFVLLWIFPTQNWAIWLLWSVASALVVFYAFLKKQRSLEQLVVVSVVAISMANWVLNIHFYPNLLAYQSTGVAGQYAKTEQLPEDQFFAYNFSGHALSFYAERIVPHLWNPGALKKKVQEQGFIYVYTKKALLEELKQEGLQCEVLQTYDHFKVATLNWKFLNPKTRKGATEETCIVKVEM